MAVLLLETREAAERSVRAPARGDGVADFHEHRVVATRSLGDRAKMRGHLARQPDVARKLGSARRGGARARRLGCGFGGPLGGGPLASEGTQKVRPSARGTSE